MRPLRQPQIGVASGHLTGHRQLLDVRNAINPDRARTDPPTKADSEVANGSASCDDDIWTHFYEKQENARR